jgi:hypothetical protein
MKDKKRWRRHDRCKMAAIRPKPRKSEEKWKEEGTRPNDCKRKGNQEHCKA